MITIAALLSAVAVLVAPAGGSPTGRARLQRIARHAPPTGDHWPLCPDPVSWPPRGGRAERSRGAPRSPAQRAVRPARLPGSAGRSKPSGRLRVARRGRAAAVFAGCCLAVAVGGWAGLVLGALGAVACDRGFRRLEPGADRRRRDRMTADLPMAADLLAACLFAGSTLDEACESVAAALGEPLDETLRGVVASVRLGAHPAAAWLSLTEVAPLAPLGKAVARAVDSGAPLAETMARLADDQRMERRRAAAAAAQRVGVRAALPLGVCFLPAFVCLGVLPVIGGIASGVLGS